MNRKETTRFLTDFLIIGIMVAVPARIDLRSPGEIYEEYEHPSKLDLNKQWQLYAIKKQERPERRKRSMNEILFCMLRAKHNATNN